MILSSTNDTYYDYYVRARRQTILGHVTPCYTMLHHTSKLFQMTGLLPGYMFESIRFLDWWSPRCSQTRTFRLRNRTWTAKVSCPKLCTRTWPVQDYVAPRNEGKTLEEENVLPGNTLTVVVAPRQHTWSNNDAKIWKITNQWIRVHGWVQEIKGRGFIVYSGDIFRPYHVAWSKQIQRFSSRFKFSFQVVRDYFRLCFEPTEALLPAWDVFLCAHDVRRNCRRFVGVGAFRHRFESCTDSIQFRSVPHFFCKMISLA